MFFKTGYWVEKQAAYSQHKFDGAQKECMLSTALDFPGDVSHRSVLAMAVPGFPKGMLPPWIESVLLN